MLMNILALGLAVIILPLGLMGVLFWLAHGMMAWQWICGVRRPVRQPGDEGGDNEMRIFAYACMAMTLVLLGLIVATVASMLG